MKRNSLILSEKLTSLINNSELLNRTAINGYEKFLKIYDKTKVDFEEFIHKIDNKIEK